MKLQLFFTCCIVAGLTVPLFNLIAGAVGSALGGSVDIDVDVDLDVDTNMGSSLPTSSLWQAPVSLMTIAFSAVVFGAIGRLMLQWFTGIFAILIAAVAGIWGGWVIGKFVLLPLKRSKPLAGGIQNTIGQEGMVLVELRSDFVGKISATSNSGSIVTYSALPMSGIEKIQTGVLVRVMRVDHQKQICIVLPLE